MRTKQQRIYAYMFQYPNGKVCCVGSRYEIERLKLYFIIQQLSDELFKIEDFFNEIINSRVYCYFCFDDLDEEVIGYYMLLLVSENLLISEDLFEEAMYLTNNKNAKDILRISDEIDKEIKHCSWWKDKFQYV